MLKIYLSDGPMLEEIEDIEEGCWVKIVNGSSDEMGPIARRFGIDMDDMRAALDEEEKSRVIVEDDYTLILCDIPASEIQHDMKVYTTIPLGIILTRENNCIITVCNEDTPILNRFVNTHVRYFSTRKRTRFVYQILLSTMMLYQELLRSVDAKRLEIEERIGEMKEEDSDLVLLHDLDSALVYFETSLRANSLVIERLKRIKSITRYEEDEDLLEDVVTENRQAIEMASIYRSIIDGTGELISNVINNRLNNTMKILTSITLVMAVPTIISGLYGMNVVEEGMPFATTFWGFGIICGLTCLVCAIIMWMLKRKNML